MDDELEKELNELKYMLGYLRSSINHVTTNQAIASEVHSKTVEQKINNNTEAQTNNTNGTTKLQEVMGEVDKKNAQFKKNLETAFDHSISMLTGFGAALVSSQAGLQKYTQTIESLGKGASALGSNFGILGAATGGLVGLVAQFASSILNLNQNTLNIRNNFAKAGGIMPTTTTRLGELAKEAGFALDSMKILGDKMAELSESMSSLGGYAGEGAIKFMQIANVEDKVRREFGRLGVSQEQLLEMQGMYVELQRVSGGYFYNQNKSAAEIQKESLQYAKTLMQLSSLTGESIQAIQKEVFAARLEIREQARQIRETREIAKLESEGRFEEAKEIKRQAENRQKTIEVLSAFYDRETAIQFATVMETGAITEETSNLAIMIPNVQALAVALKKSTDLQADLGKAVRTIDESMKNTAGSLAEVLPHYPELADTYGLRIGNLLKANTRSAKSIEDIAKILNGKMEEGEDPLADNVEGLRSFERETKKLFQTLIEYIDPMRNFNKTLAILLGTAAAALTGLAVLKIGHGLLGGLFERGASFARPNHIILTGASGLTGAAGSAMTAGSAADPTGLGLRKADLLDKNGKPLGGAALDARMKKIAGERLPKTTSRALRQAAKNAGPILKGAATLASSIVIIGAGVAGATWLVGKAIPTFAEGMKKFNEVDGDNLKKVGLGMAGLGAGILALAAEKIVGFFNTVATIFGAQSPLERTAEKLVAFQNMDIDADKVEKKGKAATAFANAFKEMPSNTVSFSRIIGGFFDGPELPYDAFEKFSQFDVDPAKTEKNSKAFISFSNAMASYNGYGALDGLGAIVTAIADSVVQHYKIDPPEKRFKDFADLPIDPIKASDNAIAFKNFAEGMRLYKGPPGILDTISSLIGTQINSIFGPDGPVKAFVQFSKDTQDIGPNAAKNAQAFFNFAKALSLLAGETGSSSSPTNDSDSGGEKNIFRQAIDTVKGWFGFGTPEAGSEVDVSKAKGNWKNDAAFMKEVQRVSSKYGFSQGALLGLMQSESTMNPQSVNPKSGATGLIQFMPSTAQSLGTTTAALYKMNRAQQMAYVDKYFQPYSGGLSGASAGKLYAYVFLPGRANRKSGVLTQAPEKYYQQNTGLDLNRDGAITIADLDQRIHKKAKEAKVGGLFTGPTSGYPMELHGTELIVPVDHNSILMKLATEAATGKADPLNILEKSNKTEKAVTRKTSHMGRIDAKRMASISDILDKITDVIESTDDIDKKILRHT